MTEEANKRARRIGISGMGEVSWFATGRQADEPAGKDESKSGQETKQSWPRQQNNGRGEARREEWKRKGTRPGGGGTEGQEGEEEAE